MDALELRKFMCNLLNVYADWTYHIMEEYEKDGDIDGLEDERKEFITKINQFCAAFPGIGEVMTQDVVDMIGEVIGYQLDD